MFFREAKINMVKLIITFMLWPIIDKWPTKKQNKTKKLKPQQICYKLNNIERNK